MAPIKILIAEDNIDNLRLLMQDIEKAALPVEMVSTPNGKIAIQKALEHIPDMMLIDWVMPEMDGIALTKQLRANPKTKLIPIIMITSKMNNMEDLQIAFDAGVTDFINRPYHPLELIARIKAATRLGNSYRELIAEKQKSDEAVQKLQQINQELSSLSDQLSLELREQKDVNLRLMETFDLVKQISNLNKS